MPTLVSRSSSVESSSSAQAPRPFAPPTLSALVAQASAVQQARSRFLSTVNSSPGSSTAADDLALDDDDAVSTASSAAASVPSPQDRLEAEFAAAVHFVDSYQGPHRILKQENSTPKREFYALYQQATVGACPIATAPVGLSKLELARWEAWRALGRMPRHEAMQKYTTALDNLVDDWRRTAGINKPTNNLSDSVISTASTSSVGAASPSLSYQRQPIKKSASTFDRLPRIFDEFSELQARLEDETRKREELEAQLVTFTRENRTLISHELHQVDTMRGNLTELVKSLEEDVAQHYNELQLTIERQRKLQATLDRSIVLRAESRLHQIFTIVSSWTSHRLFRRVLLVLFFIRVWNFVRHRRMPQSFAQFLIRLISSASSLESTSSGATTRAVVRR